MEDNGGRNRSYSEDNCLDVCAQQHVINKCGCFDIDISFTDEQLIQANNTACGNLSLTSPDSEIDWDGLASYICSNNLVFSEYTCDCPISCSEFIYTTSISSAPWPSIAGQLNFYQDYIRRKMIIKFKIIVYVQQSLNVRWFLILLNNCELSF